MTFEGTFFVIINDVIFLLLSDLIILLLTLTYEINIPKFKD